MKKIITLILAAALTFTACLSFTACSTVDDIAAVKEKGKIVVGITDYEPMDYKDDNGKWIGFDAELAQMFAEELDVDCEFFEIADWGAKVAELNSNQFDLIWNGMTASNELGKQIDLSIAYAKNAQVIVVKKGVSVPDKEAVKSMSVAVESGSAGDKTATAEKIAKINAVDKQLTALFEVASGNSDAAMIDLTMAESVVGKGEYANLEIVQDIAYGEEVFAVGMRKNSNLTDELNKFLKAKYEDGTMEKLLEKYAVSLNKAELEK